MSSERLSNPTSPSTTETLGREAVTRLADLIPQGVEFPPDPSSSSPELVPKDPALTPENTPATPAPQPSPQIEKMPRSTNPAGRAQRSLERRHTDQKLARRATGAARSLQYQRRLLPEDKNLDWSQRRRILEDRRAAEANQYLYESQVQEFLSTPKSFAELSQERDQLIDQNGQAYFQIGAEAALSTGFLDSFPSHFILQGFRAVEGADFENAFEISEDLAGYGNFQLDLREKVTSYSATLTPETIKELEASAAQAAIYRGVFRHTDSFANQHDLTYSAPVTNPNFADYLRRHDLDPSADAELRRLSYHGFGQIIEDLSQATSSEATASLIPEELAQTATAGLQQLDGYYQTFDYLGHKNDFLDYMLARREVASSDWQQTFQDWLATHPELAESSDENLGRIAEVDPVSIDELEDTLRALIEDIQKEYQNADFHFQPGVRRPNLAPEEDNSRPNKPTYREKLSFRIAKIERFINEARTIKEEIDPYADFYIEKFDGEITSKSEPFIAIRYGDKNTATNNLIAEDTAPIGAMYLWCSKENGDAWRDIFRGTRGDAIQRPDVARVRHNGIAKDAPKSTVEAWARCHQKLSQLAKIANGAA